MGTFEKYLSNRGLSGTKTKTPTKTVADIQVDRRTAVSLELEQARRKREEASKKRQNYTGKGSWLMYANPEVATAMNEQASSEAEREYQYFNTKYNELRAELYQLENQSKLDALGKNAEAAAQYTAGQTARSDRRTLLESLLPTSIPGTDLPAGDQDTVGQQRRREYAALQQKYGARDIFTLGARIGASERQAASELENAGYNFDRLADYEQRVADRAAREAEQKENTAFADEHGVLASAATVPVGMAQGADYLSIAGQTIANELRGEDDWRPVNTDKLHATNFVRDIRGRVGENIEEKTDFSIGGQNVARFLYDTSMSMGDSATAIMLAGPAATYLLGGAAASQTAIDVLENGGTAAQATMSGLAAGAAETIFEKYSVDSLLEPRNVTSVKRLLTETLKQGGVEATEEMATEVANILSNALIMGQNSDFNKAVENYTAQGMTADEAKKQAILDCIGQIAWAGAGGALSGGVMGGGVNAMNLAGNAATAQQMYGEDPETLISQTLAADEGNKLAKKLQDRIRNKQDISGLQLSTLNEQRLTAFEKQQKAQKKRGEYKLSIEAASQKYGKQAEAMKTTYDSEQNVEQFDKAFGAMHRLAKLGVAYDMAAEDESVQYLTDKQKKLAYDIGRTADEAVELADAVSEYEISAEGKTVQKSTDKAVELGEVVSVDGGTMTFALSDGSEAVSTDLSYATEDEAMLYTAVNYAANTAGQANLLISGYKDSGMSGEAYSKGIRRAYDYGRHQLPMGQMMNIREVKALPAEVRRTAYEAGKTLREHRTQQKQAALDQSRQGKKADKVGRVLWAGQRATKNTAEDGGVKYSQRNYAEQVDEVLAGTFDRTNAVYLGGTPKILSDIGLDGDLPMLTTAKHLKNANRPKNAKKHQHGLTEAQLKRLPEAIANPVIVMDSLGTTPNSVVVVTDMVDSDGNPVVVAIQADGKGMYNNVEIDTNFVLSYYGKDGFSGYLSRHIQAENLLFYDKEKSETLSNRANVQFVGQLEAYRSDTILRKTNANVNRNKKHSFRTRGKQEIRSFREHLQQNGTQLTEVQEASIFGMERLTALIGVDMYVFESYVNDDGERVYLDENGREVPAPNGYYENGNVYIDLNAGERGEGTMLFTVAHELTHFIREWSPAKYDVLCEVIMDGYARAGISVDQLVRDQIIKAKENGRTLSYEEAFDEVVADSMESMLADGRVIEMMAQLKQRDKGLWEKICDFFTELLEDLKAMVNAYKHHKPNSKEGRMVADMQEVIDKIQPIFAEALLDAGETRQTATKNTAEDSGVQYSIRDSNIKRNMIEYGDYASENRKVKNTAEGIIANNKTVVIEAERISEHDSSVDWDNKKEVRSYLKSILKAFAGDSVYFTHDGQAIEAYLTKDGINHSVTGNVTAETAAVFERICDLIVNAEYAYSSQNDEHSNINKKIGGNIDWDCFVAVASVGVIDYPVVFKLRTLDVDLRSQIYSVAEKREIGVSHDGGQQENLMDAQSNYGASPIYDDTVSQSGNSVKKFSDRSRKTAATLERENKRLKQDVKYLRELVRLQKKVTDGSKVKRRDVETMAKLLMRSNNVKGDYRELTPMLTDLYEFMAVQEEPDMEVIREKAQPAVDWLLDHVQESKKLDPYAEEILGVLKGSSVRFNDAQKAEAASLTDGWGKYRNSIIGAISVSDKATQTLDQLWADLSASYPKTFDADISDAQQPAALLEIIEELRSMKEDSYGFDPALLEQAFLQEVYDGYWRVSTLDTVADVYQKRIDELKAIHFEEMEQSRAALMQQMDLQEAAYQQYMEETIAQERAQVQKQKDDYTADRRKAVEKRKKTARKKSIQKTAKKLDTLLNRGTKEKNIKEELQPMVSRALTAANAIMQTDNELDYIRFGVAVDLTTGEQKTYDEARELLAEIDAYWEIEDAYDGYDEIKRTINRLERSLNDLKELHGREIAARKRMNLEVPEDFSVADMIQQPLHCNFSNREAQIAHTAKELLHEVYQMKPSEVAEYTRMKRLESKLNYRMKKLTEVFERERIRRDKTTVSTVLNDLATAYQTLEGATGYLSGAYDAVVYDFLRGLNETIGKTNVKDMSLWQLERIDEAFTMVLTTVNNVNEAFTDARKRGITEMGEAAMKEFGSQKQIKALEVKGADVMHKLHWNNLKPVYAFERLGSAIMKERFDAVRKGEDVYARDVTEARQFYLEKAKKFGAFDWNLEERIEFEDADGKRFKLNRDQMMSIYAYSRRKQAHEHLLQGGIVFDENTEIKGEKIYGVPVTLKPTTANTYRINGDVLQKISQTLTEDQRLFAQEMQDYLSDEMAAKGNEVSVKMYGVKLFKEQYYFPLHSAKQFNRKAAEQQEAGEHSPRRLKNNGMTKAVVPEANNPIILSGFMDTWSGHVDEMSMYHAFVLPLEDFNRVFKYMTQDPKSGAKSVDAAMQNAHGSAATQYVTQLINDLNGGARSDSRETPMKGIVAKWKKAAVFASASVVVQQPSAIGRAFALVNPKYFRPSDFATFGKDHTAVWDEVKKYAPVAIIKEMGYFDTNMGQSTAEFLKKRVYETPREQMLAVVKDPQYRDDKLSLFPAYADEMTWCTIWGAVKREQMELDPKADVTSEAFLQKCGERFTEVIGKTQVYDSVLARSGNMRSKGLYMNMATAFMAEPTTSINMVEDAVYKMLRGGDKKAGAKQIAAVVASVILNSVLVSFVYAARDDDEDETFREKYFARLVEETKDGLNPLTYLPIVKDIWSVWQGYDVERADMSLVADVVDAINNLRRLSDKDTSDMDEDELDAHNKAVREARLEFVDYATAFAGIPFKNVRRDFKAVINLGKTWYKDATERDTTLLSLSDAVLPVIGFQDEKTKTDKLYYATVKGDGAYVKRLNATFETEKARNTAIRKALRANDPRIKEAAVLYVNGDYDGYRSLYYRILDEKKFSQDNIINAIQAEINALTPDEATEETVAKIEGLFNEENYLNSLISGKHGTAETIKQDVINTYVANGSTQNEAEKKFISKTKIAIKDRYMEHAMSADDAYYYFTAYAGMDETEATNKVNAYTWMREHPQYDFTVTQALAYTAPVEGLGYSIEDCGIAPNTFADYQSAASACEGEDKNGDGKADANSKKNQILAVIDSLPISNTQKDALYILNDWARSNLRKAPWH